MTAALIQKIHIAKAQLGLDDDTYRAALVSVTGKDSSKAMSDAEREKVLRHFQKAGFKPKGKAFTGPSTKYAAKIHALWISGWNLGVIRDNSDAAMEAFILRQTKISKAQWLKDAKDAAKVIDALKAWLAREAGVEWGNHREPANAVLWAQADIINRLGRKVCHIHGDAVACQRANGDIIRKAQEATSC